MSERLAKAIAEARRAGNEMSDVLREDYPIDGSVTWERNGRHGGVVVLHGYGDRVKVKNVMTGNEYWICADDIVRAMR